MVSTRDMRRICLRRNYVEFFCARFHTNTVEIGLSRKWPIFGGEAFVLKYTCDDTSPHPGAQVLACPSNFLAIHWF